MGPRLAANPFMQPLQIILARAKAGPNFTGLLINSLTGFHCTGVVKTNQIS